MLEGSLNVRVSLVHQSLQRSLLTTPYCLSHRQTSNFFYIVSLFPDYYWVCDSLSSYPRTSLEIKKGIWLAFTLHWGISECTWTTSTVALMLPLQHVTSNSIYDLLSTFGIMKKSILNRKLRVLGSVLHV